MYGNWELRLRQLGNEFCKRDSLDVIHPASYGIQTDLETDFFFLLKASLSGVVVQLPSRNFSSTQNRKPEREIKSREEHRPCLDHAEESRCEVSLALSPCRKGPEWSR
ncbi:hypothetical protein G5I_11473 [Acromyrmex echinatior]|uniref:Uncharacterized protein n=1 Tax=Acromyrmex echinatior TaxID=103372 RepID=F4WZL6_ACREC|nr:hypothetical protein G5I_11473 [Acromyrmex echinatior]